MIAAIAEAIMQKYNANQQLVDVVGLHYEIAPEDTEGDYAVFFFVGGDRDEIMGGADDAIHNIEIQFNLFSDATDGGYRISAMHQVLNSVFDWTTINVAGYSRLKFQPTTWTALRVEDNYRQISQMYELSIEKEN